MSEDSKTNTSSKKSPVPMAVLLFAAAAVFMGAGVYFSQLDDKMQDVNIVVAQADIDELEKAVAAEPLFDLALAKRERILGDRSAPIKITEHSSFTCGHCGRFHRETYQQLKAEYIDTGKAYLVFSDFPLNAPALHASMISRCVAEDRYFEFTEMLFAEQDNWAYDVGYLSFLKTKAGEFGLGADAFESCLNSAELQETLVKRIQAVGEKWDVRSTPSFVINNQKVISGALPFAQFDEAVQQAIAEITSVTSEVVPAAGE